MIGKEDVILYQPVYNDFKSWKRSYDIIQEQFGFRMMVGDGRFKYPDREFPQINNSDMSTDELVFFCEKHPEVDYFYYKPAPEYEKLNYAMVRAHEQGFKIFILIGADAYLVGDLEEFLMNLNRNVEKLNVDDPAMLKMRFKELKPNEKWNFSGRIQTMPRIYYNYHLMEARNLHWLIYDKREKNNDRFLDATNEVVDGIMLFHDNSVRPKERDNMMTQYQDKNVLKEREIYYELCAPRQFKEIVFQTHDPDKCSWETKRDEFLKNPRNTHLIVVESSQHFPMNLMVILERLIKKKNNVFEHLPIISSVTPISDDKFVIRKGCENDKALRTDAMKKMYNGFEFKNAKELYAVPYKPGYMICMERQVVEDIEHFGELEDFVMFCNGLGHMIYVAPSLRVEHNA